MQPTRQRPLPDQDAIFSKEEKPKPPDRAVKDEEGKERQPPDVKIEYMKAKDKRRQ